jgi:hypothetical protein
VSPKCFLCHVGWKEVMSGRAAPSACTAGHHLRRAIDEARVRPRFYRSTRGCRRRARPARFCSRCCWQSRARSRAGGSGPASTTAMQAPGPTGALLLSSLLAIPGKITSRRAGPRLYNGNARNRHISRACRPAVRRDHGVIPHSLPPQP